MNQEWEKFLRENSEVILEWLVTFVPDYEPKIKILLNKSPLDTLQAYKLLGEAWWAAPDKACIRTPAFFKLCDLLDGTIPFEGDEEDEEPLLH